MGRHVAVTLAVALLTTTARALADQQYEVVGQDLYRIGTAGTITRVVYTGSQRLSVARQGKHAQYDAQARYTRSADSGKLVINARFVQELMPNGSFEDRLNDDPDFLTILNQPFAVQLDAATLHDLSTLHGKVPFDATSPLGGEAVLRGYLRPGSRGEIDGRPAIAVRFQAEGPMTGPLPDHASATMQGRMRMDGSAYYSLDNAMLLALDATLTIVAQLNDEGKAVPVYIVYRRYIRAKTLRPAPPAAGAGTATPPAP